MIEQGIVGSMIRTYTLDLLVSREAGNVSQTLRSLTTPALPNSNSLEISTSNRTNYFSWRRVNSCSLQPEATLHPYMCTYTDRHIHSSLRTYLLRLERWPDG